MIAAIYLRKSRADADAPDAAATLDKHESALIALAKSSGHTVTRIFREVVSADSIASRPQVRLLLSAVEDGEFEAVLCMDVDRLARGDTIDQGIIAQTFKLSGAMIVTPTKTYDPNNEFDEEYFEFGLFMARREYKLINRRLQRGREASVRQGKYPASKPPYGYEKIRCEDGKGFTLRPIRADANVVRYIFELYTRGEDGRRFGFELIAKRLNELRIKPSRHDYWVKETIRGVLTNPVYSGKIRWGYAPSVKKVTAGVTTKSRPRNRDCLVTQGLHEAIITPELFAEAAELIASVPPPPTGYKNELKNPLAGLIVCGLCGRNMVLRRGTEIKPDYIVCHYRHCKNVSAPFPLIEQRLLQSLELWLESYRLDWERTPEQEQTHAQELLSQSLRASEAELQEAEKQLGAVYDFHERGIYTTEAFLLRSEALSKRIAEIKTARAGAQSKLSSDSVKASAERAIAPKIERLLELYPQLPTAAAKNSMLKEVLKKAVYLKALSASYKGVTPDAFELTIHPLIPG